MPTQPPRDIGGQGITRSDTSNNTITVFGATGTQGGSVVRQLLEQGTYKVRAVTRDVKSESAQSLARQGVQVVVGDLNDEELTRQAVAGSYAVFGITNSWDPKTGRDPKSGRDEYSQGIRLAKAAKDAGVQVFIWAGLPNVKKLTNGKHDVSHFTEKGKVWDYTKELGFTSCTSLEAAFYFSNLRMSPTIGFNKNEDGTATFSFPVLSESDKLAGFDPDDTGIPVPAILESPERYDKKRIVFGSVFNKPLSGYLEAFTQATGVKATLSTQPYESIAGFNKDLANMFVYFKECMYYGGTMGESDVIDASEVSKGPYTTLQQWLLKSGIVEQFKE